MPKYTSKTAIEKEAGVNEKVAAVETAVEASEKISDENSTISEKATAQQQIDMMEQFKKMMESYQTQIANLKDELNSLKSGEKVVLDASKNVQTCSANDSTERLLNILANRKSDKEVTIVHNRELIPGLSTHITLTGMTIDFHTLGEERVLSWTQFEECVSKYKRWFDKQIILLSVENADLAERYNIPCVKRSTNNVIARSDLIKLADMDRRQLEDYFESLTEEDRNFICSYWLGKCYERDPKFYDRYKVELMNQLSRNGAFDNILALMNGDFTRNNDYAKTDKK